MNFFDIRLYEFINFEMEEKILEEDLLKKRLEGQDSKETVYSQRNDV